MDFANLPAHKLAMDEPAPSEVVNCPDGLGYRWILTNTERAHIADMLNVDGELQHAFLALPSQ